MILMFAYNQFGYYIVVSYFQSLQKKEIREKILSQLKDEDMEVISINDTQNIYWEEDGKEFYFNNEMYDVVKRKVVNGKEIVYCINDKKETALVANYNAITQKSSSSDKQGKSSVNNAVDLFVYPTDMSSHQYAAISLFQSTFSHSYLPERIAAKIFCPPKA